MTAEIPNYYWDTCVFIAHLNDDKAAYGDLVDDINQFLNEAAIGECVIHCSTITIAEITRSHLKKADKFESFMKAFHGTVVPLSPDPNLMALASELRSLTYTKSNGTRKLQTPDAIHLASALTLIDVYGVPLTAFHTFDNGKSKGPDGPGTPLLSFETWCEKCKDDPLAKKVIELNRCKPEHPNKKMVL